MSSLFSLLICLALMFTGSTAGEARSTRTLTIDNIVLTIGEEEYVLDPSVKLSVAADDGEALLDFGVLLDKDVLLPIQAKASESGLSVLLGQSEKAYTLTAEALEANLDASTREILDAYVELIKAIPSLKDKDEEKVAALNEKLAGMLGDVEGGEEVEFTLDDGETVRTEVGKSWTITLDNDQLLELVDYIYAELYPDFGRAYFKLLNSIDVLSHEEEHAEITSFKDFLKNTDMTMSLTIDAKANDTCGVYDYTIEIASSEESYVIPFTMEVYDPTHSFTTLHYAIGPLSLDITAETVETSVLINAAMSTEEGVTFEYTIDTDGETYGEYSVGLLGINGVDAFQYLTSETNEDGSVTGSAVMYIDNNDITALSFDYTLNDEEDLTDRIATAEEIRIESLEEINESGIYNDALLLTGDLMKLQSNESVANAIAMVSNAFEQGFASASDNEDFAFEGEEAVSGDRDDLSFVVPKFNGLPEGYALANGFYYPEYDIAYEIYAPNGDPETEDGLIYVNISPAQNYGYSLNLEGERIDDVDGMISVQRMEDYLNASYTAEELDIYLNIDGDWMTDEQIATFFRDIEFVEEEAE